MFEAASSGDSRPGQWTRQLCFVRDDAADVRRYLVATKSWTVGSQRLRGVVRDWLPQCAAATYSGRVKQICEDATIGIRRFRAEDAEALYSATRESVKDLCHWMVWCRPDYSLEDSRAFIIQSRAEWDKGRWYTFVIYGKKAGEILGSIGLSALDRVHGIANLGYWVRSGRRGEGIGAAAVRLVANFALGDLGLHRLELIIPVENLRSLGGAEKAGAEREGILKGRVLLNGKHHDAAIYSIVRGGAYGVPALPQDNFSVRDSCKV